MREKGKVTYHGEVPLQAEEHFMFPHRLKVSHISRQQQSLLHGVGHVSSLALLEVPNWGITREKSSV